MRKSLVPEAVENHIAEHLVQQSEPEAGLHAATMHLERAGMCSSPEVGQVLAFLVGLVAAKRVLEIGVFTGYASLKMASALPADGLLIACDISDEWPAIGKPFWAAAGADSRIDLRIGPALETIRGLGDESIDMAFIDADKSNYPHYFEEMLRLLRPGGLIVLDNMLWSGRVADMNDHDSETVILRELGIQIANDPRVSSAMLTVGDGLMLARVLS